MEEHRSSHFLELYKLLVRWHTIKFELDCWNNVKKY